MPPRQGLFILNPRAGNGTGGDAVRELVAHRREWLKLVETTHKGHATDVVREALARGVGLLVAGGGDGLVSEVVEGLASDFTAAAMAIVPLGTANDFARATGIPVDPAEAFAAVDRGHERSVDVIRATDAAGRLLGHVLNMATGGFAVELGRRLDQETKKRWGRLSYLIGAMQLLADPPMHEVTLTLDGRTQATTTPAVLIANGPAAGGMAVMPEAHPADAMLDVALVLADRLLDKAALAARFAAGTHLDSEHMFHHRAHLVRIVSEPAMAFHADGERLGATPMTFELLPRVLRLILPTPPSASA